MSRRSPTLEASKQSAPANFSVDPCSLVVQGMLPRRRRHQTQCSYQTGMTKYDLFFQPLLSIVTFQDMTIKQLMYTRKVPFLYTERASVLFSGFQIHLKKFSMSNDVYLLFRTRGSTLYGKFTQNQTLTIYFIVSMHYYMLKLTN